MECEREASVMRRLWPTWGCCTMGNTSTARISSSKL